VHAIDRIDLKTAGLMGRNPDIAIHSVEGNQHFAFAMSTNQAPFDDSNVRLAMKYAIDRQELVDKILFGHGAVGNDHPIGRGQRFFNDDLEQTAYDPDRAKFHLKKAGLESVSVALSAADAGFVGSVDAATLYQASASKAGVEIDVIREPNDGYWSDVWMKKPFSAVWWAGRPVEDVMLTTVYASGAAWNDTYWDNARFNELLVAARSELDEEKRREMYYEMQAILNVDGGAIIPVFANFVFATGSKVMTGDQFSTQMEMDGERWMERWSFA
jgi:peptide/nickel transport system substrate-binding protein